MHARALLRRAEPCLRNPTASLVRGIFQHPENARGELEHLLPRELSRRFDWSTLKLLSGSFVDEVLSGSQSDLLFSVYLDGSETLLYFLLEHQSTSDPLLLYRLLKYMVRVLDRWLKEKKNEHATRLPPVIPFLLCHAPTPWSAPLRFEEILDVPPEVLPLIADFVPRFRPLVDDLTATTDEEIFGRALTAAGRVTLWCLRNARDAAAWVAGFSRWVGLLRALDETPNDRAALPLILRYIFSVHEAAPEVILPRLQAALSEEQLETMATIEAQLIAKGEARGRAEGEARGEARGRAEGAATAARSLLLRQLQLRFGSLPPEVLARIDSASRADLDLWADRIITAAKLSDILDASADPPH
ncbi:MAG: Rpn family recombination-promoting nuclease/putative transposase [Polyangiaceae bacterium]